MGADEWSEWIDFESHYDLPDGYFVVAQLGSIIAGILGNTIDPVRIVPYLARDDQPVRSSRNRNLGAAFSWLAANVDKDGKPK